MKTINRHPHFTYVTKDLSSPYNNDAVMMMMAKIMMMILGYGSVICEIMNVMDLHLSNTLCPCCG